jgi:hypothetical protein
MPIKKYMCIFFSKTIYKLITREINCVYCWKVMRWAFSVNWLLLNITCVFDIYNVHIVQSISAYSNALAIRHVDEGGMGDLERIGVECNVT